MPDLSKLDSNTAINQISSSAKQWQFSGDFSFKQNAISLNMGSPNQRSLLFNSKPNNYDSYTLDLEIIHKINPNNKNHGFGIWISDEENLKTAPLTPDVKNTIFSGPSQWNGILMLLDSDNNLKTYTNDGSIRYDSLGSLELSKQSLTTDCKVDGINKDSNSIKISYGSKFLRIEVDGKVCGFYNSIYLKKGLHFAVSSYSGNGHVGAEYGIKGIKFFGSEKDEEEKKQEEKVIEEKVKEREEQQKEVPLHVFQPSIGTPKSRVVPNDAKPIANGRKMPELYDLTSVDLDVYPPPAKLHQALAKLPELEIALYSQHDDISLQPQLQALQKQINEIMGLIPNNANGNSNSNSNEMGNAERIKELKPMIETLFMKDRQNIVAIENSSKKIEKQNNMIVELNNKIIKLQAQTKQNTDQLNTLQRKQLELERATRNSVETVYNSNDLKRNSGAFDTFGNDLIFWILFVVGGCVGGLSVMFYKMRKEVKKMKMY